MSWATFVCFVGSAVSGSSVPAADRAVRREHRLSRAGRSKRPKALTLAALALVLGTVGALSPWSEPSASAGPRSASSAGSDAVGSASYAAPAGAIYVATWGSDANGGSSSSPVRTLTRALAVVGSSGTIVMRAGSYNEQVAIYQTVTIQNYPGETVWVDGSIAVTGWVQDGSRWRHDGWTTRFDSSPTYTKGAPDSTTPHWQFLSKSAPMAAHPDQVWIDGTQQTQVASLSQVGANTFFLDEGTSRLYLGSDPSGKQVSASNRAQAMNIRAAGVVVRGIGVRRFAPSVWHVGAITFEKPNIAFENVVVTDMATTGISIQSTGAQLRKVTVEWSGMLGIHGRYADNVVMTKVLARRNNSQFFNIAPVSGGVKLGVTRGVVVTDSAFSDNYGPGFWEDMSVYNSVFRGSNFTGNSGDGLFLEISARVVVGDSLFANNRLDGIKVNNTANVKIWNNTFVGNGRPLDLVQDFRRNTNRYDPAVDSRVGWPDPEMPWQLDSVTVSNNVVGLSTAAANCLLCVEDYSSQESGESMKVQANGNVYVRPSTSQPTWLAVWSRGAANPYIFTSLAALRTTTGQESRGREYTTGTSVLSTSGVLSSSVQDVASQIAVGLPSDVGSLIGQPSGSTRLGMWSENGAIAPAPAPAPPVAPPPVAPVTPGPLIAQDFFERSATNGWGPAEVGGNWTVPTQSSRFTVAAGAGQIDLLAGDGFSARLDQVSSTGTDARLAFSLSQAPVGAGHFVSVIGRQVATSGDYRAKIGVAPNGDVSIWLAKYAGGSETVLTSTRTSVNYRVGETLKTRVQVSGTGSTAVRAKVWKAGTTEPSDWMLAANDSTASLQAPGSVGVYAYTAGSATGGKTVLYFDALQVAMAN